MCYARGTHEGKHMPNVTINSARYKQVGQISNIWGSATGYTGEVTVTSQVFHNGGWSNSQSRTVKSGEMYTIPLTYGKDSAGYYRWRVVSHQNNTNYAVSEEITFYRTQVSAYTAGTVTAHAKTNVWGSPSGFVGSVRVSTQVFRKGKWVTSQTKKVNNQHLYTLPLTYGKGVPGTTTWRVVAQDQYREAVSSTFTLTRTAPSVGYSSKGMVNPTDGGYVTTPFGKKPNNSSYWRAFGRHTGADFSWRTVKSRDLYACDSGFVTYRWDSVLGHVAILRADSLRGQAHQYFWYCHLTGRPTTGKVRKGQRIGTMGESGTGANGVHLHLELTVSGSRWGRKWNDFRDPASYVKQR